MRNCRVSHLPLLLIATINFSVFAEDEGDFLSLSLAELMQVEVSVAAKRAEPIAKASGNVTLYQATDIEKMGYFTLDQLASITPGYSVGERLAERGFTTRGLTVSPFNNNKQLLIIDDIPIQHARNYKVFTGAELPLYFAERVEFLSGPGSALYGTSAVYGAINITPKKSENNEFQQTINASISEKNLTSQLNYNVRFNDNNSTTLFNFAVTEQDSADRLVNKEQAVNYFDDIASHFAYFRYQRTINDNNSLTFGLVYLDKGTGLGESTVKDYSNQRNYQYWQSIIPYIKYQWQFGEQWRLDSFIKYNQSIEKSDVYFDPSTFPDANEIIYQQAKSTVKNWEVQTELSKDINENTAIIVAVNYDNRQELGDPDSYRNTIRSDRDDTIRTLSSSETFTIASVYGQLQQKVDFLHGLTLTAGWRYDSGRAGKQHYDHTSPRLALVQQVSENFSVKLLYGSAFNSPGIKEVGFNLEVEENNPGFDFQLKPELFESTEISALYFNRNFSWQITFFNNNSVDSLEFIKKTNSSGKRKRLFSNSAKKTNIKGFETNVAYYFNPNFSLKANYSYAKPMGFDSNISQDAPKQTVNVMLNYASADFYKMNNALILLWVDDFYSQQEQKPSGYSRIDWQVMADATDKITLSLQAINLLNQNYYLPKNGFELIPDRGRSVKLAINLAF